MARMIRLLLLLVLGALVALVIVKMRASRSGDSAVDGAEPLSGSFDTWPEVPIKQTA